MIPRVTVDKILDAALVEEVVGEFITLKKRGTNLLGLCPFHGEKTPSFTVSAVKGIYKCFGCGKAGNSVNFIMDHLQLSYPEALKWLARKYNIEVIEKEITPEEREQQTERESMLIVMQYAQRYFTETMMNTDEGKSIGLGYFKERELRDDIIAKFQLGYSLEERNAFTKAAVKSSYAPKYLAKTGMSIVSNRYVEGKELAEADLFDRYAGRVMFPIQDDGGRVVAFGGRTLSTDKKTAKYINSPETEIYNKSKILYGLWLGKKAIQNNDACYLVEGYMDVIAMHQAGIENVVASSGTSLTVDQIKSIHRFTRNIIVLYDGDEAGQKASNRAIPLLLEEGMNVRLLQFPNNDDPDSYSRKVTIQEFQDYIKNSTDDFLYFKAKKLKTETANDPIKRAGVIKDIVENIAVIPDNIIRSIYIKECANIMEIEESILQLEVNKIRRKGSKSSSSQSQRPSGQQTGTQNQSTSEEGAFDPASLDDTSFMEAAPESELYGFDAEEEKLLCLLIKYGNMLITTQAEDEVNMEHELEITLGEFIIFELWRDEIVYENPLYKMVLDEYIEQLKQQNLPNIEHFLRSPNPIVSSFIINHVIDKYEISPKWKNFGVLVPKEIDNAKRDAQRSLFSFKSRKLSHFIHEKQMELKTISYEDSLKVLEELKHLDSLKGRVNKLLGREVIK
ncbi:DNA primase [Aurantibacillus circumpalustris]|uniref:DNA primase n=1 Tax=Aurantibacillus circumpalustris TaxID=3036359 RepID=UPI00295BB275|nr:DNA primase [Aurantibacillus circumpalustris]